jgi:hypothetical protein
MTFLRKAWQRGRDLLPVSGFHFDRPIVLLQSDDWGRLGLRDQGGLEELRAAGLKLGDRPYDLYTLETADDLSALADLLKKHRDSAGQNPSIEMNFVSCNLDFARMVADEFRQLHLLPLAEGLPRGWTRPGLLEAYRSGIADGVFHPALHGSTHFCRAAVEHSLQRGDERSELLQRLWRAGTPYIHWRMPWIGFEYWDPDQTENERFLPAESQRQLIGQAVGWFAKLFSLLPHSACAPGYRANDDTHQVWAQHGISIAQNGPGALVPPHFGRYGMLHLYRTVEFEPATDDNFSVEHSLRQAKASIEQGIPAIVSIHSINFHSTVKDFRSETLQHLDQFFTALESGYPDLLYIHDQQLLELVKKGTYGDGDASTRAAVTKKNFRKASVARRVEA